MQVETARRPDHPVHFYTEDASLASTVATFLAPSFATGEAMIAIGTPEHVVAIEERLRSAGHDVEAARATGQYRSFDAQAALDALMLTGVPTTERFDAVIGPHLKEAVGAYGSARAFGEIVSLLWQDGKRQAALRLEELWNEALGYHPLALVCGYDVRAFKTSADALGLSGIIGSHTGVVAPRSAAA